MGFLTTIVVIATYVVTCFSSIKHDQTDMQKTLKRIEAKTVSVDDWDMMLYWYYRNNPKSDLSFPTALELKKLRPSNE